MIELDRHIEILLLSNDCVIVPGLGGFMAHHVDARYDEEDSSFLPPLRTLGFNPQLKMNDSLLVQSYIEAYDISYPEALRRIENEVNELRQHLETNGQFELNDLGILQLNEEGNLEFEPCEAGILTPDLYGLSSFEMKPLALQVEKPVEDADTHDEKKEEEVQQVNDDEPAITIRMSWLRNVVAVAAAIVAFFMIGTPVSNSDVQQSSFIRIAANSHQEVAKDSGHVAGNTTQPVSEAVAEVQEPQAEESATAEVAETAPAETFTLVMASHVTQRNAENFVNQLHDGGFPNARVMNEKMVRVVYGTYATEEDALSDLRELRSQSRHFREAWVMKVK